MKIRVRQLRKLIHETLLLEVACPECGNPNAYIGLSRVECPNRKCSFFSQKQADDFGEDPRLKKLLDYAGLWGLDAENGEITWKGVEVLKKKYGFKKMSDFEIGTGDVVSPKHWRVVANPNSSADPGNVVYAGTSDEIWWEAVSKEAKNSHAT